MRVRPGYQVIVESKNAVLSFFFERRPPKRETVLALVDMTTEQSPPQHRGHIEVLRNMVKDCCWQIGAFHESMRFGHVRVNEINLILEQ